MPSTRPPGLRTTGGTGYRAFISYSQKDRQWGARLHRWLESYRVPSRVAADVDAGRRLGRFFRDDDEMPADADIGERLRRSIDQSESLIVICSPRSAQSRWVAAEIRHFRRTGRGKKVFAFIIDGVPNSIDPETECFPAPLRAAADPDDPGAFPIEPLGVDIRKDGRVRACARLAAGLLGVDFDDLWQRDRRRAAVRQRRLVGGLSAAAISFGAVAIVAVKFAAEARKNARRAEAARANLLTDTSARLLAEGDPGKALGYAAAAFDIARTSNAGGDVAARSERAMRQALIAHVTTRLRLAATYRGHEGRVTDVALSADGRLLATAGDDGTARIYVYASGELVKQVSYDGPVAQLFFVDGDRYLVAATRNGTLKATSVDGHGREIEASFGTRLRGIRPAGDDAVLAWGLSGKLALWRPLAEWLEEIALDFSQPVLTAEPIPADPESVYLDRGISAALVSVREQRQVHAFSGVTIGRQLDKGLVAIAGNDAVEVVDVRSGRVAHTLAIPGVVDSVIDADADRIAILTAGPWALELWSLSDGVRIATRTMETPISGIAGAHALGKVVTWTAKGQVTVYGLDDGMPGIQISSGFEITDHAVSGPAGRLLFWSGDGRAGVWSLTDGALLKSIDGQSAIRSGAFSATGNEVWLGRESGELQIVSLDPDALEARLFHDDAVLGWRFVADGSDLLTWAADGTARRWNAEPSPYGYLIDSTRLRADIVVVDRQAETMYAAAGTEVVAFRVNDGQRLGTQWVTDTVTGLMPSLDGSTALVKGQHGVCAWNVADAEMECQAITTRALPFGKSLFAFFDRKTGKVTAVDASRPRQGFLEVADEVANVALVGQSRALALCRQNGNVLVCSDELGKPGTAIKLDGPLIDVAGSNDRNRLVAVGSDGAITVLDLDDRLEAVTDRWSPGVRLPSGEMSEFNRVTFERQIVFAGRLGRLLWLDPETRQVVRDETLKERLGTVVMSKDLQRIMVLGEGHAAFLFDRVGGKPLTLDHRSNVLGMRFLGDAKVVTWSADRMLTVWDAVTGRVDRELAHFGIVQGVTETHERGRLIAWTDQRELIVWDLQTGARLFELRTPGTMTDVRFLTSPERIFVAFKHLGPMVYPYVSRQHLHDAGARLLDVLRPFGAAERSTIHPAGDPGEVPRQRVGSTSQSGESFLEGLQVAIELGMLKDGSFMLVSDRALNKILQLVEYNEFDQLLTLYAIDGSMATMALPVSPSMLHSMRKFTTIIFYSLFPDHPPIGYRVPLARQ